MNTNRVRRCVPMLMFVLVLGLAAAARPATAAITFVSSSTPTLKSTAVASITLTAPAGIVAGDMLLAWIATSSSTQPDVATSPAGWTGAEVYDTVNRYGVASYYKVVTAADVAGTTTYNWTLTTSAPAAATVMAFRGVLNSSPIADYGDLVSGSAISHVAPSVTPGVANSMLVALYAVDNGNADTMSLPAGMTQIFQGATGNGSSGLLIETFYQAWAPATATGTRTTNSGNSLSAAATGALIALQPAPVTTPIITALYHLDQPSWSGTAGEVIDSGGNAYNGVAVNGATTGGSIPVIGGPNGTCFYGAFNGTARYVKLPSTLPDAGATFTITAWIYPTAASVGRIFADDAANNGYALSFADPGGTRLRFYSRTPSLVQTDSAISLTLNQWYFVVAVMDATTAKTQTLMIFNSSGTQIDSQALTVGAFSAGTGANTTIGGDATGTHQFPGNMDEVIIYGTALTSAQAASLVLATHVCSAEVPNHYAVSTAGTAVNCAPAPVTIAAHTSTHAVLATSDSIVLGTSTGRGDWALSSGNGVFAAGTSNSGAATYTYAAADNGSVALTLRDTFAEAVTINVTDGSVTAKSGTATGAEDSPLTFLASGFIVTNGSNAASAIATQDAGVASVQNLALQAVRTDTATGACTSVFASGTTVSIGLAYQCNNPTACVAGQSLKITNNGTTTALASNPNSGITAYTSVPLKFSTANAEAPISLVYSDAGQITLAEKYTIPLGNGSSSGNTMLGTGQFVVQPYTLQLSAIKNAANVANPAASTAAGTVFTAAGQPFKATITALNFLGTATPNFGQETAPASVSLVPSLVLPASGHNPAISGTFGAYTGGVASGTAFAWPEAGIVSVTPVVTNYLGSGNVSGTVSGNVGRFVPNNFIVAQNTPIFATGCSSGSFTYLGQPFVYTVAPVLTATALALGGATTLNYSGSLFRLTNASLTARTYTPTPASPALNVTGLPATTVDPTIASLGSGQGSLTFNAGTGISFVRGTPIAPLTANVALSINVIDLDAVSAAANPVTFGSGGGIVFSTSALQYYGRLALRSSLGSELLDLPVSLTTQYYVNGTQGFTPNTADVCSTAPSIALSNYLANLAAGETCVRDSGSPGVSGAGCAAVSSTPYAATAVAGDFNLVLAAPGGGNNGALTLTATPPAWLMYLWNAGSGSNSAPAGIATFGEFTGPASRVYQREIY
jgi:MSHA biogenesis protein MshQ